MYIHHRYIKVEQLSDSPLGQEEKEKEGEKELPPTEELCS